MRFETQWPGDNVAAAVCATFDWGGWDGVDPVPTAFVPRDWRGTATAAPTRFGGWRRWVGSIASIVARLWPRVRGKREFGRIRAAWRTIDDRTLKDIGMSRIEFEYAKDARQGS